MVNHSKNQEITNCYRIWWLLYQRFFTLPNTISKQVPQDAKATIQRYKKGIFYYSTDLPGNMESCLLGMILTLLNYLKGLLFIEASLFTHVVATQIGGKKKLARYAGIFGEFQQEPVQLQIKLGDHQITLYCNGFSFTEKRTYFESMSNNITVTINQKE